MAVATESQGRTVDVQEPRDGVPRTDQQGAADAVFADAKAFLSSSEARQMSESELERELHRRGQELIRKLLQEHHDQRSPGETAGPAEDASGVECSEPCVHDSPTERTSDARHHDDLQPLGAAPNLLPERSLFEIRRVRIATTSRAPPRAPWKPHGHSTSSTWQRRCGVRRSLSAPRRACRHAGRDWWSSSRNGQPALLMQPEPSTKRASPSGP